MFDLRGSRARPLLAASLALVLSGCTRGCAGQDEIQFCDAVERRDEQAAQALFDSGKLNLLARNVQGTCQPIMVVFRAAHAKPAFNRMAMAIAGREGMANTCWTPPRGSSGRGAASSGDQCPIDLAALYPNAELMKVLIANGVSLTNQKGRGAVTTVIANGSLPLLRLMIEGGADKDAALQSAIAHGQPAATAYLESVGARETGVDPLLVAARRGDLAAIDAAVARKADLEVRDAQDRTPLMRAVFFRQADAVARLARAGAALDTTFEGHTALHIAANNNDVPVLRALIAAGARLDARGGTASPTPLLAAIENGSTDAVRVLVDAGADPNVATDGDTTAVARAASLGNLAMVRDLIRGGARVNERKGAAWKPPVFAALGICGLPPEGGSENDYYRVNLLKALVAAGALTTVRNDEGLTPIEVVSRALAGATEPFYRECYQAKLAFLKSLPGAS